MIAVKDIEKSYNSLKIIDGISFDFDCGKSYAIVGRNGSGKSTFLNCLTGRTNMNSGQVLLRHENISRLSEFARSRLGLTGTFQQPPQTASLTLTDIKSSISFREIDKKNNASNALNENVSAFTDVPLSLLSFGQRKLANLFLVLYTQPDIVVLDEPIGGLSIEMKELVGKQVRALTAAGKTVIVVEHDLDFVRQYLDEVILLNDGVFELYGTPNSVLDSENIVRAFQ